MSFFSENIVFIWIIPVVLQILIPLAISLYSVGRKVIERFSKERKIVEPQLQGAETALS